MREEDTKFEELEGQVKDSKVKIGKTKDPTEGIGS